MNAYVVFSTSAFIAFQQISISQFHPQRRTVFRGAVAFSPDQLEALLDVAQA